MGWRTVTISKTCKLDLRSNYMSVRSKDSVKRLLLDEIDSLILETTAVSITAALLLELSNKGINVVFCDQQHNPHSVLNGIYGSHNSSDRIRKQINWPRETKDIVWKRIIRAKIEGQNEVLNYFSEFKDILLCYRDEVEVADSTNREGHAAKIYFNRLFGKTFSRRNQSVTNACLDYGYAILLSLISREIVQSGYLTQLGIHHDNQFNKYNLSCDLMEPFRPFVDAHVLRLEIEELSVEGKRLIAGLSNEKVKYCGQIHYLNNAIHLYCKNILNGIESGDIDAIEFVDYGL